MKEPREKAIELVHKFKPLCKDVKHTGILNGLATVMQDEALNLLASKMCALIAVEDILQDCDASSPFEVKRIEYWQEVKKEIEKL
jgi:hypothetical protein